MRGSVVWVTRLPPGRRCGRTHVNVRGLHLRQLFVADSGRGERMALERVGVGLDYSRTRLIDETAKLLVQLVARLESAVARGLDAALQASTSTP